MSKSKKRILAGIMSLLLIITSVFTGNVVATRAEVASSGEYDAFVSNETYPTIVEVAVLGYDRGEGTFPISFDGVDGSNTIDGWDRMKARVNVASLTISWDSNAEVQPTQICVEGAGENGNGLIHDVTSGDASYTISLNRIKEDGSSEDYYYVEVKYGSDYDLFGPDETNPILVEVEYKNVPQEVSPSISFQGVTSENYFDGGDRIKARVNGDSATITWSDAPAPTQICVQGAGKNGDWLIHDVTGEETSYTISLNRKKENGDPEDYYFVEVKYGPDSPSSNDITYDTTSTISSNLAANNVTISGDDTVVTLGAEARLRIDGTLSVGGTAQLKGTDHTSVLELGNNASIEGIDVYNSAGTKLSNESHRYTNSGEGAVEFEWDSTNEYWKLRSSQAENHSIDVTFIPDLSALPGDDTSSFKFYITGLQDDNGTVSSVGDDLTFSKTSDGSHTFHLSVPDNAVKLGFSLSNAGKKIDSASFKVGDNEEHILTGSEIELLKNSEIKVQVFENDVWATNITFKVKLTGNSGGANDITYDSSSTITSNLSKDNVTIVGGCRLTVDNCTLTIGQELNVYNNADVVGTSENSKLEFQPNASSNGIALYNTQGREITDGQEVSFTNGSNTTVFTWNTSNERWETEQAEESGNGEIIGNETKDVVIKFWELKNGEYVQADISRFDRMSINGKIFAAEELINANYKVTRGGKDSGTNAFFFKGDFLNKITDVKLISSFTETDGKKTGVTINESVSIAEGEDEVFLNQQGEEEGRIKSPWRAELPVTTGETEEYNFLIIELQRGSIVWTGATENNYHGYGPDAYVEYGKVQLVSVKNGETDLIANNSADANEDSYDLEKNEGYIFAPVGSTVTVRLVPDYGYQVIGAEINGVRALTAGTTVSTFSFDMPEGNVHFRGVFTPSTDKITTPASEVSSATIENASNAASSGNLSLNVADNTSYAKTEDAKTEALGGDTTKIATTVATLDMTLDNIVNKNTADSYWTTSVTEFTSPITVGLKLNDVTLADGEELVVVREHNGTLEKIDATYNATTGTLSVPTNKFSTYSIVKLGKKEVSDAVIAFDQDSFTYDGTAKEPTITIDGAALDTSKFTVTYTNSSTSDSSKTKIFAGTVTVRVTAKADNPDYTGYQEKTYTIAQADPNIGTVSLDSNFGNIYTSTSVAAVSAALTRTNTDVSGTLELTDVTSFATAGASDYNWKFTPTDTVNYQTKAGTISLTVLENTLSSLSVSGALNKTAYVYGDEIDLTGITVTATFENRDTLQVPLNDTNLTYTAALAVGQTLVTLTYTSNGTEKTADVTGFMVSKAKIDLSGLAWTGTSFTYNGSAQGPTFTSSLPTGVALDGEYVDASKTDAGNYTAVANIKLDDSHASANYEFVNTSNTAGIEITAGGATAKVSKAWSIARKSISGATITLGSTLTYDGTAQTQAVNSVVIDGRSLTETTEYTITGNAQKDAGTYTLTVIGNGNYDGTVTKEFTISKATLTPVLSGTTTKVYDNTANVTATDTLTLSVTGLQNNETVIVKATSYTFENANVADNKEVTASGITISGDAAKNYQLSETTTHAAVGSITKATPTITLSNLSETTQAPTGVKASISPEDATAEVVIEYQVELSANGQTTKQWVTTRPAVAGTYPVRAYLPEGTTNLEAVTDANAITGTYILTQYTAPTDSDSDDTSDDSSPSDTPETSETTGNTTTTTTTKKPTATTEENKTETIPEKTTGVSSEDGSEGWKDIKEEIKDKLVATGEEAVVTVEMNGEDTVPADVFETIKGQDITVTFDMGNGIVWAVNGMDVTADSFEDINFSASTGDGVTVIPAELILGLTEDRFSMELTLEYEGEFGFIAVMSVNVDKKNAGKYANLFYFNPKTETMEFICSAQVKEDGTTDLTFTHASDYVIVVDEVAMSAANNITMDKVEQSAPQETPVDIVTPEEDVFNPFWIIVIGIVVLLVGGIAILTVKKKNE